MESALELRALLLLACASAAFTALTPLIYRRDPARRKGFLLALAAALVIAPWWSLAGFWTWPLGLNEPAGWLLGRTVPSAWLVLWWSVAVVLMLRTLWRVARGRRTLERLPAATDGRLARVDESVRQRLMPGPPRHQPATVRLGMGPCASTLGSPLIVLPDGAGDWPVATLTAVFAHEHSHLQHLDDRLALAMRLLADWYWWLPWLRSLQRRYVETVEERCDELASRLAGAGASYVDGLVDAARRLGDVRAGTTVPAWVGLLGHSHLARRVARLTTPRRPTLDHADGRCALFWSALAFAVAVTAQPASVPTPPRGLLRVLPLTAEPERGQPRTQVQSRTEVLDARSGRWRAVPGSAREPLPIYPVAALRDGLSGIVIVDLDARLGADGRLRTDHTDFRSSDPSGTLTAAVERALRTGAADLGAGLRAVSAYDNSTLIPPPGTPLRLRKTYRFVTHVEASADHPLPGG